MPELTQGSKLIEIIGPTDADGGYIHISNHDCDVAQIKVSQIAGPMGWIDVAVVYSKHGSDKQMHPRYMMETIRYQGGPRCLGLPTAN